MVKKFTVNCDFGGQKTAVELYIGEPFPESHPFHFQDRWLMERKVNIPEKIRVSFARLAEISEKNRVSFQDLCAYVIEELEADNRLAADAKKATALSKKDDENN
jgi:hypothetical protein